MKYYHSTKMENLVSISEEGLNPDKFGFVYLAESELLAAAFDVLYNDGRGIVLEVELDENLVEESFDHNEKFFSKFISRPTAKCFTFEGTIHPEFINFDIVKSVVSIVAKEDK